MERLYSVNSLTLLRLTDLKLLSQQLPAVYVCRFIDKRHDFVRPSRQRYRHDNADTTRLTEAPLDWKKATCETHSV